MHSVRTLNSQGKNYKSCTGDSNRWDLVSHALGVTVECITGIKKMLTHQAEFLFTGLHRQILIEWLRITKYALVLLIVWQRNWPDIRVRKCHRLRACVVRHLVIRAIKPQGCPFVYHLEVGSSCTFWHFLKGIPPSKFFWGPAFTTELLLLIFYISMISSRTSTIILWLLPLPGRLLFLLSHSWILHPEK